MTITGDISIHTQNIFPIIKKWLYSEPDIFIRELLSNAKDAITKRQILAKRSGSQDEVVTGLIEVAVDETARTITISDNGLGMDETDLQTYINQVAFSGATTFIESLEGSGDTTDMIGHFGLGFYSAFMVADRVEIHSLSCQPGAVSAHWECEGSTAFTIRKGNRESIGTDVILHIGADHSDLLGVDRIRTLVKKYANYLPVEIKVNGEVANVQQAIWSQPTSGLTQESVMALYRDMVPGQPDPLFWIHLNVDYPFRLTGILFFPQKVHEMDGNQGQIQLYCQNVFVSESARDIVPAFLNALQGVIDCPDLPLNVSRSFLQQDSTVQKMSNYIVKKVSDRLQSLFKEDRAQFETIWGSIGLFIKYGMLSHDTFYDKIKEVALFKTKQGYRTLQELKSSSPPADASGSGEAVPQLVYSTQPDSQTAIMATCEEWGYEVIHFESALDTHLIPLLESKESCKLVSVEGIVDGHLSESQPLDEAIKTRIESVIQGATENVQIRCKGLADSTLPALVSQPEFLKRTLEMTKAMRRMSGEAELPMGDETLVVNYNHPLVKVLDQWIEMGHPLKDELARYVVLMGQLMNRPLKGEESRQVLTTSSALILALSEATLNPSV